ncbi:solute carrier family 53 member 1-like isoform X2 [Zophobas morio]|uniref:solute carrier family 53 member 1-like isoform X2 n=1 Tax=Zophobas morio TaxID=2755281 RepID=UPI0030832512
MASFSNIRKELLKIEKFYSEKVNYYSETLEILKEKADTLTTQGDEKGLYHIKQSFVELFRRINLLEGYSFLNYTGFNKILKKHDKQSKLKLKKIFMNNYILGAVFADTSNLKELLGKVEEIFSTIFENGDKLKARRQLLKKRGEFKLDKKSFYFGMAIMLLCSLILWATLGFIKCLETLTLPEEKLLLATLRCYYPAGLLCLLLWTVGWTAMIWSKNRINYCYIFELDPKNRMAYHNYYIEATKLSLVTSLSLLLFLLDNGKNFKPRSRYYPLLVLLYMLLKFVNPLKRDFYLSRLFIIKILFNVVISPFGRIRFVDFFVADILTSLAKVFTSLLSVFCLFGAGFFEGRCDIPPWLTGLVAGLPLWFRFVQCLRQYYDTNKKVPSLLNSLKYSLSLVEYFIPTT